MAVLMAMRQFKFQGTFRQRRIYWVTDSENVVRFLEKGSRKKEIQKMVFEIANILQELQISVQMVHLRREDPRIQVVDEASKAKDTDNWSVDELSFAELNDQLQFDTDLFADCYNKRVERFCSLYFVPGTFAVDAFSVSWADLGMLWICPPISLLPQIHFRISNSKCRGVIIFPLWFTSSYLGFFFEKGTVPKPPYQLIKKWRPYVIQNENATNTALFGAVPFEFVALFFNK